MRYFVCAAAIASLAIPRSARAESAPNAIFGEVLGNGIFYSINYERLLATAPVGLRVGASYFTYGISNYQGSGNLTFVTVPLVASYYVGHRAHKLQLGLGATVMHLSLSADSTGLEFESERSGTNVSATAVVGYRYLPAHRGISFGVGFTPLLRPGRFLPWGGASLGYAF
jgi:hypothetical protein